MASSSSKENAFRNFFDVLWEGIIHPVGIKVTRYFSKEGRCNAVFQEAKKDELYVSLGAHFKQYIEIFAGKYIDQHKLSSLLVCSIVNVRPMEYRQKKTGSAFPEGVACNEIYAIICAINLLKATMIVNMTKQSPKYSEIHIQEFKKRTVLFPESTDENNNKRFYLTHLKNDIYTFWRSSDGDISTRLIPLLFHVFYFIEEFNLRKFHEDMGIGHNRLTTTRNHPT